MKAESHWRAVNAFNTEEKFPNPARESGSVPRGRKARELGRWNGMEVGFCYLGGFGFVYRARGDV